MNPDGNRRSVGAGERRYTVNTTNQTTTLSAYRRALRIAGIGMPVTTVLVFIFLVTGIPGFRGGWLWAPLIAAVPAAMLGWHGWGDASGRAAVTSVVVVLGIALGLWFSQEAVMSHGRLKAQFDALGVPESFEMVSDEPGGWSLCFDECTSHTRTFLAPGSPEELQAGVADLLGQEGFVVGEWRPQYGNDVMRGHRGRLGIRVTVADWMFQDGRRTTLPPGQTHLTVTLDTYSGNPL